MKNIFVALWVMMHAVNTNAQYHVKVVPNPMHHGAVSYAWQNNYVITYTLNNWRDSLFFYDCNTYSGQDNDGRAYNVCFYEIRTFSKINEAAQVAKLFKTITQMLDYEGGGKAWCADLSKRYEIEKKKLNFKRPGKANGKTLKIY
jgi:hypothetical protein